MFLPDEDARMRVTLSDSSIQHWWPTLCARPSHTNTRYPATQAKCASQSPTENARHKHLHKTRVTKTNTKRASHTSTCTQNMRLRPCALRFHVFIYCFRNLVQVFYYCRSALIINRYPWLKIYVMESMQEGDKPRFRWSAVTLCNGLTLQNEQVHGTNGQLKRMYVSILVYKAKTAKCLYNAYIHVSVMCMYKFAWLRL